MQEKIHSLFKRSIVREFSWHTLSAIATQIFAFIGMIFVSRYLGPTNLGLFAFVQNYIAIFITVLAGLDFYFTWHISKSHDHIKDVFIYIVQKTQVALILFIVGIVGAYIFLPKDVFILSCLLFTPLVLNGCSAFITYALSQRMARLVSATQVLVAFIFLILKFVFVYFKLSLVFFVTIQAIDMLASGLIIGAYFLFIRKWLKHKKDRVTVKMKDTFTLLLDIRYNMILIIFWQLVMRADQLILAKLTNAYTLGIYAAAVKLAEAPNAFVAVLGLVSFPRIVNYVETNTTYAKHQVKRFMYVYLGSGVLVAMLLFIFADLAIQILYGQKFEESVNILKVYAFSVPGLFLAYYYMSVFGALEERKIPAVIAMLSAILNISFVIIFTKSFGILGTALASAISYSISGLIFHLAYKYYLKNLQKTKNF